MVEGSYLFFLAVAAILAGTGAMCLYAKPIADWLKVFDYPRGGRKHHASPTPQVGGFAVAVPVGAWLVLRVLLAHGAIEPFDLAALLCGGGVAIIGIMDDQSHLSASGRILLLAIFAFIAFALDPRLAITEVHWAAFASTPSPAWLFILIATLAITGFVSSVNMADGIDGLVPAAFLIWCAGFAMFTRGETRWIALALMGPLAVVLGFNLRGKLFLGDCGTFGIGFVIALMALTALSLGMLKPETLLVWFALPVIDCIRVIAARILTGRSPLKGGKDHFHHVLSDIFGKKRAFYAYTLLIFSTSLAAALISWLAIYLLVGLTTLCVGFVTAKYVLEQRRTVKLSRIVGAKAAAIPLDRGAIRRNAGLLNGRQTRA
jgi:UDP-GlcNAc:undecaprenyl-phosphate GlcNAc-1-phosphate transferase